MLEKLKSSIPKMKEWGQHSAAELCEEAVLKIESLDLKQNPAVHGGSIKGL